MKTFSLKQVREDALKWVSMPGRTRLQLAKQAGVDWKSIDRFLSSQNTGLAGKTIEKLWPVIYENNPKPEKVEV
jgi:hypothetical protein